MCPETGAKDVVWYDLDPHASDLWVVAGPHGHDPATIDPDNLPDGFRWVSEDEWEKYHEYYSRGDIFSA
jgi:hypothetical protein